MNHLHSIIGATILAVIWIVLLYITGVTISSVDVSIIAAVSYIMHNHVNRAKTHG